MAEKHPWMRYDPGCKRMVADEEMNATWTYVGGGAYSKKEFPLDQIESLSMIIGECCHVASRTTADGERTLTVTRPDGVVCVFKGHMEFNWVMPPGAPA